MNGQRESARLRAWAIRQRVKISAVLAGAIVLVAGTISFGRAASLGTIDSGTLDHSATSIVPDASVRDLFPEAANTQINGLVADFNDGSGWTVNAGPTWAADTNWRVNPSGSAQRNTGSAAQRAALFPFLLHDSSAALRINGMTAATDAGPMLYSSNTPNSPNGVYAGIRQWTNTSVLFEIWDMQAGAQCNGSQTVNFTANTTSFDLTLTFSDTTAGGAGNWPTGSGTLTATVRPNYVGATTTTRTCNTYTPTASRAHAGIMAYTNSPASYNNLLFSYAP